MLPYRLGRAQLIGNHEHRLDLFVQGVVLLLSLQHSLVILHDVSSPLLACLVGTCGRCCVCGCSGRCRSVEKLRDLALGSLLAKWLVACCLETRARLLLLREGRDLGLRFENALR